MAEVHLPHAGGSHPDSQHETSDVNLRAILGFLVGLTIACVFINFVVWLLFTYLNVRESRPVTPDFPLAVQKENRLPPAPRLQPNPLESQLPREALQQLRDQEDRALNSYGWVDQNAGVVRIPIDRAMKMLVERGVPARAEKK